VENLTAALQKYRVVVSRGQNDRSSSSSENEYDEGTVTETYSAFGEGEALCDASTSVKDVQRNLQEQMEVRMKGSTDHNFEAKSPAFDHGF
jgi:hypothetical protein